MSWSPSEVVRSVFASPNLGTRRPQINDQQESNVPGLFVVGELAGASVVKLAMQQGVKLAKYLISLPDARSGDSEVLDVLVVGAGAAGLSTALELKKAGLKVLVIEKGEIGTTIAELPEGKFIYGEPKALKPAGELWFEETNNLTLAGRWREQVAGSGLTVLTQCGLEKLHREKTGFRVATSKGEFRAKRIVLATGKSGTPRHLNVPGEDLPFVQHRLYSPKPYQGQQIVVVGGGNSAAEAAIALAGANQVTLVYRGSDLYRVSKTNQGNLAKSGVKILYDAKVERFEPGLCYVAEKGGSQALPCDHAWVLVGANPPEPFLRSLGLRLENDWNWTRVGWLLLSFFIAYTIYGVKQSPGHEFWPYTGWGHDLFSFGGRPWSFWYTVLYTAVVTIFGIQAMKRWGFDRKDKFQIWRYVSLIGFQWTFFFLIPEFLFRIAVEYQWVGAKLAADPNFANNAWRSYGMVYAWPLFFYTFFNNPADVWIVWGLILSFVLIPVLVLFHGKRYCSWICGCGGLAETLGDRWRHLSPKGPTSIQWERMNGVVLVAAAVITLAVLGKDTYQFLRKPADSGLEWYHLLADTWLVGIIPVTLYPFLGGKIWCRYWCPLAKMMEMFSRVFTRFKASRFSIAANEKCIACEDCTRNCQVGIDVMKFALKQEPITNLNSSCIGCGICVTVCPMNVLSFADARQGNTQLVQISKAA
jgi:NosR/NirI family transcriptional regulator, nitrous oxide reductase regulator